jgi:hypothetical protein
VKEDCLWCAVAFGSMLSVADVSSSDVHGAIGGEGDAVGELLAPACV